MERSVTVALGILLFLFGAATMFVGLDVLDVIRKTGRRGEIDFTAAAARGELLHLDWGDPRKADPEA